MQSVAIFMGLSILISTVQFKFIKNLGPPLDILITFGLAAIGATLVLLLDEWAKHRRVKRQAELIETIRKNSL